MVTVFLSIILDSNWMEYDRGCSFPFAHIPFNLKGKLGENSIRQTLWAWNIHPANSMTLSNFAAGEISVWRNFYLEKFLFWEFSILRIFNTENFFILSIFYLENYLFGEFLIWIILYLEIFFILRIFYLENLLFGEFSIWKIFCLENLLFGEFLVRRIFYSENILCRDIWDSAKYWTSSFFSGRWSFFFVYVNIRIYSNTVFA